MKITRVGYGETVSDGHFNNVRTWFEADLEEGESSEQAIEILRAKCFSINQVRNEIITLEGQKLQLEHNISQLHYRYKRVKESWDNAKAQWQKLIDWAKLQGFELKVQFPPEPYLYPIDEPTDNNDVNDEESDDDREADEDDIAL